MFPYLDVLQQQFPSTAATQATASDESEELGFLDRLARGMPNYGLGDDVDPLAMRAALDRGLLSFGATLLSNPRFESLGPALERGLGAHEGYLTTAHARQQAAEGEAAERERLELEASRQAEAAAAVAERRRAMLERLPPEDRLELEPLLGDSKFDSEYAARTRGPANPEPEPPFSSASELWVRQPDGTSIRMRRSPDTGEYAPVVDPATGEPLRQHRAPAPDRSGAAGSKPPLSVSGELTLISREEGRLEGEREDLERLLEERGDELTNLERMKAEGRLDLLSDPRWVREEARRNAETAVQEVVGRRDPLSRRLDDHEPPAPPPGPVGQPPAPAAPPSLPPEVAAALAPEDAADEELMEILVALSATMPPEAVIDLIEQERNRGL